MPLAPKGPDKTHSKRTGLLWIFIPVVVAGLMWGIAALTSPYLQPANTQTGSCVAPTATVDPGGSACSVSNEGATDLSGLGVVSLLARLLCATFVVFIPLGLTIGILKIRRSQKKWPMWLASAIPLGLIVGALVIWYLTSIQ